MKSPGASPVTGAAVGGAIAIVVLTHNRVHLLRKCVENVLGSTSAATREIVIWNNGSTDGTREFLDTVADPRTRIVHSDANIGMNAYARAFAMTSAEYLVELDDDVVDAPPGGTQSCSTPTVACRRLATSPRISATIRTTRRRTIAIASTSTRRRS